jgi:hypothetical protein
MLAVAYTDAQDTNQLVGVFKILKIFRDRQGLGTWIRILWYGEDADTFLGSYLPKVNREVFVENLPMDVPGTDAPWFIHWGTKDLAPVLTKGHKLVAAVKSLIQNDIRLRNSFPKLDQVIQDADKNNKAIREAHRRTLAGKPPTDDGSDDDVETRPEAEGDSKTAGDGDSSESSEDETLEPSMRGSSLSALGRSSSKQPRSTSSGKRQRRGS